MQTLVCTRDIRTGRSIISFHTSHQGVGGQSRENAQTSPDRRSLLVVTTANIIHSPPRHISTPLPFLALTNSTTGDCRDDHSAALTISTH